MAQNNSNWLELDYNEAGAINDRIEDEQKQWDSLFTAAANEAARIEQKKITQRDQLLQLIGQAKTTYEQIRDHNNNKALAKEEFKIKAQEQEVIEGVKPLFETGSIDLTEGPKDLFKDTDKDTKVDWTPHNFSGLPTKEYEKKLELNVFQNEIDCAKNDVVTTWITSPDGISQSELLALTKQHSIRNIDNNAYANAKTMANQIHNFMANKTVLNTRIQLKGMDDAMSLSEARAKGDITAMQLLRSHYIGTFLDVNGINEISDKLKREVILPEVNKVWDDADRKWRTAEATKAANTHTLERRRDLTNCLTGGGGINCAMGADGYLARNESRMDGSKDTPFAKAQLLSDLKSGIDDGSLGPEDLAVFTNPEATFIRRDTKKPGTIADMDAQFQDQLGRLYDYAVTKKADEKDIAKKNFINTQKDVVDKFFKDKAEDSYGGRIDETDIQSQKEKLQEIANDQGIHLGDEEMSEILGDWNHLTYQDMEDDEIIKIADKRMDRQEHITDWQQLTSQITDDKKRADLIKKIKDHNKNLPIVTDSKEFDKKALEEINLYLGFDMDTKSQTPRKGNMIDNANRAFKAAYKANGGKYEEAKEEVLEEIRQARSKGTTSIYEGYQPPPIKDTDLDIGNRNKLLTSYMSTEIQNGNRPTDLLKQRVFLPGESERDIEAAKRFLAGRGPAPALYYTLEKQFPKLNVYSIAKTRVDNAVGGDTTEELIGDYPVISQEEEIGGEKVASQLNNKADGGKTYQALTDLNAEGESGVLRDTLKLVQKTNDPNAIRGFNVTSLSRRNKLEGREDKPLEEMTLNEIDALITNDEWGDASFGLYGIKGKNFAILIDELGDGDLVFNEETQNKLALLALRLKANSANSLSPWSWQSNRIIGLNRTEIAEFNRVVAQMPDGAEKQFFSSPWNQLDILIPGAEPEVANRINFPIDLFGGLSRAYTRRIEENANALRERGDRIRQERLERRRIEEQKFPQS